MTLEIINEAICNRPDVLLTTLGLEGEVYNDRIDIPCPIHNGDNAHGVTVYFNDYRDVRGRWKCNTRSCERTFKNSLIGFTRGVLSNQLCDWSRPGDEVYGWSKTIQYLKEIYGLLGTEGVTVDPDKQSFIRANGCNTIKDSKIICTKDKYLWYYASPPQYYRERGFSDSVLEKYNVRYCDRPNSKLYRRCCVPIYDDQNRNVIGISARTTCDEEPKWRNTTNFPASTSLYNYSFASEYIKRSRSVVIVEGPADVWKLVESGINNCVAIWGVELNDYKKYLLDKLGVMRLVLALDNDEAGIAGTAKIIKDTERIYNTTKIQLPDEVNDVGEMDSKAIKSLFKGA